MDASCLQRQQDIMASQSLDSMLQVCTKPESQQQQKQQQQEKKPRPSEEALKCPRCDSSNTKFCYYNNYSLTQPRYFCKSCRRYWTKGGTLRNVPVGGGCRKNKRCSSSSSRRSTPDHLQSFITSPTSSSQQLISPLSAYEHYNNNNNNNHPFSHHGNIPLLGNGGNTHFDLFGNQFNGNLFDSLRSGVVYHEGNNNPQSNGVSLYYGVGGGHLEDGDHHIRANNNVNLNHEDHQMGMQFDLLQLQSHQEIMSNASSRSSTPTIKHELGDNRSALFSYIMTGAGEIDTPRESWNNAGVLGSSWHNLLNSPLM